MHTCITIAQICAGKKKGLMNQCFTGVHAVSCDIRIKVEGYKLSTSKLFTKFDISD